MVRLKYLRRTRRKDMNENRGPERFRGGAGLVVGLVLVLLGLLFLVAQFSSIDLSHYVWPLFIIVPGLMFFVAMVFGGKGAAPLAVPGSIITVVGLILFLQNITDHYETWAYAWALIPAAVGAGLMIQGVWTGNRQVYRGGTRTLWVGIILFVAFAVFFEIILNISGFWGGGSQLWPLILIAGGIFLLWRVMFYRLASTGERKSTGPAVQEPGPVEKVESSTSPEPPVAPSPAAQPEPPVTEGEVPTEEPVVDDQQSAPTEDRNSPGAELPTESQEKPSKEPGERDTE